MPRSIAAITGASSGIGAVFARRLAPTHDLILTARRKERLDELAQELAGSHRAQVEVIPADLGSDQDTARLAERLASEERLELLVNNAGFGSRGFFWQATLESQELMHRVHVMATVRLTHAALAGMVKRDRGAIINVASVAAFMRNAGSVSYNATKSWMAVFTEALYLELRAAQSNVRTQALCPGYTYSEFHDLLKLDRSKLAGPSLWTSADDVVDQSLRGLERNQLFVIPGWRYRLITSFVSKLPAGLRVGVESAISRSRRRAWMATSPE